LFSKVIILHSGSEFNDNDNKSHADKENGQEYLFTTKECSRLNLSPFQREKQTNHKFTLKYVLDFTVSNYQVPFTYCMIHSTSFFHNNKLVKYCIQIIIK
jgi:hypothetical protein